MPTPRLDPQNPNLTLADHDNIVATLGALTNERNLPQQFMNGVMTNAKKLLEFLKKPKVRAVLLSAGISFTAIFLFFAGLGFNLTGIGAGSLATAFQSAFYGALTPAEGLFATLQSMGMLGTLLPVQIGAAGVGAVVVSGVVWLLSRGRE